jgi:ketosteroid isomerase-like protein
MTDDRAWTEEELFWIGGEEHYRKMLDDECIMVFPGPTGEPDVRRSSPDVLVLAYKAEATREGAGPYAAYCTSTYRRESDRWRPIQHQQTPT